MTKKRNSRYQLSGFTMIELLIVIVILGILMTVGLGNFVTSQQKGRDSQRKADLSNISKALELYYNDKGGYPISTGNTGILTMAWGSAFYDPAVGTDSLYMTVLPSDPRGSSYYYESSDGLSFYLYTELENLNDGVLTKSGSDVMVYSGTNCTIGTCNYGISSTNTVPSDAHTLVVE